MKFLLYIVFVIAFSFQSYSKYWQEIDNIPAPYNQNYWLDVFFYPGNANYGWVCGFNGMVLRTTNGGNSWNGSIVPNAYHLEHIHFPSLNVGYASGPDGIWRTTDGGATWRNVTPDDLFPDFWGCYFLDNDNGVLLGGGCISNQAFYKTTDGGNTWSAYYDNEPNSGLTDAVLYPSGEGYASSSGLIWQTTNFGSTWNIFSRVGNKVWQEEITKSGSSFLVPYSGYDCQGGGDNGGAKFTVDNGLTWRDKNTGVSMFGAYLLSPLKGWACGDQDNVIYTSDGGLNWEDKDCGLDYGDYDDMWFINEDNGWIVGAGIYKLAQSTYPISKDTILIENVCIGQRLNDTIWINNNSFDRSTGRILIPSSNSIYLLNTPTDFMINQCSLYPVIISYFAQKDTTIQFNLNIIINESALDQKTHTVTIILKTLVPTSFPQFSDIIIDSIQVGSPYQYNLKVFSESNEENLIDYEKLSGSPLINISTKLPIRALSNGNNLEFEINSIDTGWVNARYRLKFDRCDFDTIINIKAYAYSPIINSVSEINRSINCINPMIDTVDILNSGNDDLIITTYAIRPQNKSVNIIGFINEKLPVIIKPKQSKQLLIESKPEFQGEEQYEILLINNDQTTARGKKSPHTIKLNIDYKSPSITSIDVIDFGEICPGKEVSLPFYLHNVGNMDGTAYISGSLAEPFNFKFVGNSTSSIIRAKDSIFSYVNFSSNIPGTYEDTLEFRISPCNDIHKVVVKGTIIDSEIEVIPPMIDTMFRAGDTIRVVVRISAIERDLIIEKIYLSDTNADWYIKPFITLPFAVTKGNAAIFYLEFSTNKSSTLNAKLIIENSSICDTLAFIDINLSTFSKFVSVGPEILDYGINYCEIENSIQEIEISNKGFISDTITDISVDTQDFEILNLPKLPYEIKVGEIYKLQVKYKPIQEGVSKGKLIVKTIAPGEQSFDVELFASFYNSQITVENTIVDFGYVEVCQVDLLDSLIFSSIGMINDTLDIINLPINTFVDVNNSQKILPILSNSSTGLLLQLLIDRLDFGENELNFKLQSRVCNILFDITIKANLIKPRLLVNPKPLDFGNIWIGEQKTQLLELSNNSNVNIMVTSVIIDSDEFAYNGNQNIEVRANSLITIPIDFIAKYEGNKEIPINFIYKTKCIDSTSGDLIADVPKEEYNITLRIGNYIATPDSNLIIAISLDEELNNMESDIVVVDISYDRKLFFPQKVFLKEGLINSDIQYSNLFGKLNLNIQGESARNLFKRKGDIIFVEGKVLAAVPDSTDLVFDNFNIESEKEIDVELINGSLKVVDFCHETAKFELQFIPTFSTKISSIIQSNELIYKIVASEQTDINVKITNLAGEIFQLGQYNVGNNEIEITNNISYLANGIYFINFQNKYWSKTYKLVIIK